MMNDMSLPNDNMYNENYNNNGEKSLILSLVLAGIIAISYVLSGGNFDEQRGMIWLLVGIYCFTVEPFMIIASTIYGIKGLKEKKKYLVYLSFIINLVKIVFVIIMMNS